MGKAIPASIRVMKALSTKAILAGMDFQSQALRPFQLMLVEMMRAALEATALLVDLSLEVVVWV
jgi:hypothetical protein